MDVIGDIIMLLQAAFIHGQSLLSDRGPIYITRRILEEKMARNDKKQPIWWEFSCWESNENIIWIAFYHDGAVFSSFSYEKMMRI